MVRYSTHSFDTRLLEHNVRQGGYGPNHLQMYNPHRSSCCLLEWECLANSLLCLLVSLLSSCMVSWHRALWNRNKENAIYGPKCNKSIAQTRDDMTRTNFCSQLLIWSHTETRFPIIPTRRIKMFTHPLEMWILWIIDEVAALVRAPIRHLTSVTFIGCIGQCSLCPHGMAEKCMMRSPVSSIFRSRMLPCILCFSVLILNEQMRIARMWKESIHLVHLYKWTQINQAFWRQKGPSTQWLQHVKSAGQMTTIDECALTIQSCHYDKEVMTDASEKCSNVPMQATCLLIS